MPAYKELASAIREVDNATALFFEPTTWGMVFDGKVAGSGFTDVPDPNSVLTVHYYCWFAASAQNNSAPPDPSVRTECDKLLGPEVYAAVAEDVRRLAIPSFMSEWGGKTPSAKDPASLHETKKNKTRTCARIFL